MGMGRFFGNDGNQEKRIVDLEKTVAEHARRINNLEIATLAQIGSAIILVLASVYTAINFKDEKIRYDAFTYLIGAALLCLGIAIAQGNRPERQNDNPKPR